MIDGIMCLEEFITPQKNRSICNEPVIITSAGKFSMYD